MAPAAFLLAVTVAVVLIRAGMNAGSNPARARKAATTTAAQVRKPAKRFWTVRAGDTFAVISSQTGVPVATIAGLNPRSSSTSLHIGQKVRIR
jgi:LysM repeat protein